MTDLTDLGVVEASAALRRREFSSRELIESVLARIHALDGPHSHDGAPDAINAWVRIYEDDARSGADRADELLAGQHDALSPLVGVPIGLKDLYAVAGKPITASSRVLADVADQDCDVWRRLRTAGMVLIGHTHTHEFAAGGTTDQVGNPWDLSRSAGGSSGGSAAALAARMVPAATGSDTAGSLRIPSACCGTSTIKPTRGRVSLAGVVPLSWTLDHGGPMARSIADCRVLLAAMIGPDRGRPESALPVWPDRSLSTHPLASHPLGGARIAVSPRLDICELDPGVARGLDEAIATCRRLGAIIVEPPPPAAGFDVTDDFLRVLSTDMRAYHRRFAGLEDRYRPALLEWIAPPADVVTGEEYAATQARRRSLTSAWADWFDEHRINAVIEPTIPIEAPVRGSGYDHAGTDVDMISFTHFWDWTGAPVVSLPAGCGPSSGLPVSVSLIGRAGADWDMLDLGEELQAELGVPRPPARTL